MAIAILVTGMSVFATQTPPVAPVSNSAKSKKVKPAKVQYTCTMHPAILSDKPGKCPKCGMTLVLKTATKKNVNMSKTKM